MTDRELLELAAKAAGIASFKYVKKVTDHDSPHRDNPALQLSEFAFDTWNPLISDGDAFRLAVKVGLSVLLDEECAWAGIKNWAVPNRQRFDAHGGDKCKAVRWAITRAAAEIGKAM